MAVTPSDLSGMYKQVYGDDITDLIPETAKLIKLIPFVSKEKHTGDLYHQPVRVTYPHGVTYAARGSGAFSINSAIAAKLQDAQIGGSQILIEESIAYETAARALNAGPAAFKDATKYIIQGMLESSAKRVEMELLYGQSSTGLGTIASTSNVNTTTTDIVISTGQWAAGIWAGMENAIVNIVNTTDSNWAGSGTALTSAAAADDVFTISTVTNSSRTIRVTGTTTGISNLDTALSTSDVCYPVWNGEYGTSTAPNGMAGLDKILTNTGTLFNISATTYNLWRANTSTVSGALTMTKLLNGVSLAVQRGLDEDALGFVNPDTWTVLNNDLAALRRLDSSYSGGKVENGAKDIVYHSQNGTITLVPYSLIKEGECFVFPKKRLIRCGAQELSMKTPGMGDQIFWQLPTSAGFGLRTYTDQALFLETPARAVKISGFTNS